MSTTIKGLEKQVNERMNNFENTMNQVLALLQGQSNNNQTVSNDTTEVAEVKEVTEVKKEVTEVPPTTTTEQQIQLSDVLENRQVLVADYTDIELIENLAFEKEKKDKPNPNSYYDKINEKYVYKYNTEDTLAKHTELATVRFFIQGRKIGYRDKDNQYIRNSAIRALAKAMIKPYVVWDKESSIHYIKKEFINSFYLAFNDKTEDCTKEKYHYTMVFSPKEIQNYLNTWGTKKAPTKKVLSNSEVVL